MVESFCETGKFASLYHFSIKWHIELVVSDEGTGLLTHFYIKLFRIFFYYTNGIIGADIVVDVLWE
jgi:hypothetical protein